jgi:hypothetical protein
MNNDARPASRNDVHLENAISAVEDCEAPPRPSEEGAPKVVSHDATAVSFAASLLDGRLVSVTRGRKDALNVLVSWVNSTRNKR